MTDPAITNCIHCGCDPAEIARLRKVAEQRKNKAKIARAGQQAMGQELVRLRAEKDEALRIAHEQGDELARLRSRLTVLEAREEAFQKERADNARLREMRGEDRATMLEWQAELAAAQDGLTRLRADERDAYNELAKERDGLREALEGIKKDLEARHFDCLEVCPETTVYAIARNALKEIT